MSQENVEIVRGCIGAFVQGDYERSMAALDPKIEYDLSHFPDGKVYLGHNGVREAFRIWLGTWEDYRQELTELVDAGAEDVVVIVRERGRGKGSGVDVDQPVFAVWTIQDRKAARIRFFPTREDALEAAGLRE
jgi:ketosteroid isomerase-like protein